jgi:hypothetical protein
VTFIVYILLYLFNFESPVGKVHRFTGNKKKINRLFFVKAPNNMKIPLLETKFKTPNSIKTMAPIGK